MSRIRRRILRWFDPAVPAQDLMHRGRHWHRHPVPLQTVCNLAGGPSRMFGTDHQHTRFGRSFTAFGSDVRSARAVGEFSIAGLPAPQPLVADIGTDAEPAA